MKKEYSRKLYIGTTAVLLLVVVVSFVLYTASYIRKFDRTLMEENQSQLAEIAAHIVAYTHAVVGDTQACLETAAAAVPVLPMEQRLPYLKDMAARQGFVYAGYTWENGILHATEPSQNRDVSGERFYLAAADGERTVTGLVRSVLTNRAATGIIIAVPIPGEEGKPLGVLMAMLDKSRLNDAFAVESFDGQGYSYIIDQEGNLVLRNKSMDYNNFFRVLRNVDIKNGALEEIQEKMAGGGSGMILYDQLGISQYAYFCPLGFNDWTVVNIVPKDVITQKTGMLTRELARISMASLAIFISLLVIAGFLWIRFQGERRAAEVKSIFLANISHEIRTPMNAIVGMSEILLRSGLEQNQEECVRCIQSSGRGLLTIINDVLDVSKIEAGKFTILDEEYGVEELLDEIATIAAVRIGARPVYFLTDIHESVPARLIGDRTRVKQILVNLVGNAVKFTEKGEIILSMEAEDRGESLYLKARVSDTGIGIRKQDMDKLFVSFNQIDSHYTHSREGTGLGLAISSSLCQMMGGEITVESEFGSGSVFTAAMTQKAVGGELLVKTHYQEGSRVVILEREERLRDYYESCLKRTNVNYMITDNFESFENCLSRWEGDHQYSLSDRDSARRIAPLYPDRIRQVGVLLRQESHFDPSEAFDQKTVYIPLFGIRLPRLMAAGPRPTGMGRAHAALKSRRPIHPLPNVRILIVDDNELNLEIAQALMEPYEMQVDGALSGMDAVQVIKTTDYDMIFMDHMMPEMDGVETLKVIRGMGKRYEKLPVVALTANSSSQARAMFLREGFDEFMEKPIDMVKMDMVLEKWLREKNDRRQGTMIESAL